MNYKKITLAAIAPAITLGYYIGVVESAKLPYIASNFLLFLSWGIISPLTGAYITYRIFFHRQGQGKNYLVQAKSKLHFLKRASFISAGTIFFSYLAGQSVIWLTPYPTHWFANNPYKQNATFVLSKPYGKRSREIERLQFKTTSQEQEHLVFSWKTSNSDNRFHGQSLHPNAIYCLIGRGLIFGVHIEQIMQGECASN